MSDFDEDDETLQLYIEESREHLESIESDLLEIEQQGENIDEELVNKVFRAAHSIKGGAGFLGLDSIKDLGHKVENVLDKIRQFELVPTPDVVSVVLEAFDYLREMIDNAVESNGYDISDHVTRLNAQLEGKGGSAVTAPASAPDPAPTTAPDKQGSGEPFELSRYDLVSARKGGKEIYIIRYDGVIQDPAGQEMAVETLRTSLEGSGDILDMKVAESAESDGSYPIWFLLASIIEHELVAMVLGIDEESFQWIEAGDHSQSDGQSAGDSTEEDDDDDNGLAEAIAAASGTVDEPQPAAPVEKVVTANRGSDVAEQRVTKAEPPPPEPAPAPPPAAPTAAQESRAAPEKAKPVPKREDKSSVSAASDSLRVHVSVLDQLMNRAGELVLARNQLLQALDVDDRQGLNNAGQRIDMVTSELQEAIMLTRMQPVGNIFNKFPRVVRELARKLGKEIELVLEGKDVELDKTIIEGLGDPLTHLVRNSCDHGVELPDKRLEKGKPANGSITLRAFHESGQVIIEIEDDGKGLDGDVLVAKAVEKGLVTEGQVESMSTDEKNALILLPGFSTAEKLTDVSGRGVGMDVVKTNLDKLGGEVELLSKIGQGTTVRIKLPLTLAIIPSLLIEGCGERFAIPQINVGEIIRIPAAEVRKQIDKVGGADVLTLRGELIPLLQLNNVLGIEQSFYNSRTGRFERDRRKGLADERLQALYDQGSASDDDDDVADERRIEAESDIQIIILHAGQFRYGMVVDKVQDTVEIVVKPMGRNLRDFKIYAGATIMGDGQVALILDVAGLANEAELGSLSESDKSALLARKTETDSQDATHHSLLLFRNAPDEHCCVPLPLVERIEEVAATDIEIRGGKKVIQYRGGSLPVYALEEVANVEMLEESEELAVILFKVHGHEFGLLAAQPLEIIQLKMELDESTLKQPGISGSSIIRDETTLMLDVFDFAMHLNPDWFQNTVKAVKAFSDDGNIASEATAKPYILLAEDSRFFRDQVRHFIEEHGYQVVEAEDGAQAWEYIDKNPKMAALVVTDIEMPNMNGLQLTQKIRQDSRFDGLQIIALTSLASDADVKRGLDVGIDDYQLKLDKESLIRSITQNFRAPV
ncbi:MAG: chemotaxis protein CheW [Gammaproteobacteria bacterium]|nr:chemotaxis protein CheW [Gammaproteobacteria bacterium]